MTVAFVLCGGEGTRLRPLTYYFQKTMVPVGPQQKAVLEYVLRLLRYHKITDISLLVNYKRAQVENFFGDGSRFQQKITYVDDPKEYNGSANALYHAFEVTKPKEQVLICYGDTLSNLNVTALEKQHKQKKAHCTIVLSKGFRIRVGAAEVNEERRITRFTEKPIYGKPVNAGFMLVNPEVFPLIANLRSRSTPLDISADFIPTLIDQQKRVYGFLQDNLWWYDVGSTEGYEKLTDQELERLDYLLET